MFDQEAAFLTAMKMFAEKHNVTIEFLDGNVLNFPDLELNDKKHPDITKDFQDIVEQFKDCVA